MQTDLLSVSINLPLWDISCEWNHTIGSRLLLASFSLCVFEQFLPFLCRLQFHCQDIHLVYPFTNGGTFRLFWVWGLLWIRCYERSYTCLCVGHSFPFSSGSLRMRWLGCTVNSRWAFEETAPLVSMPTSEVWGFQGAYILAKLGIVFLIIAILAGV